MVYVSMKANEILNTKKTDSKVGLIKQIALQKILRMVPEAGLEPARYF